MKQFEFRGTLLFFMFSLFWIFGTDSFLFTLFPALSKLSWVHSVKGAVFVILITLYMSRLLHHMRIRTESYAAKESILREEVEQVVARLQMHLDRMPIGLVVTDSEFRIIQINRAAEQIFGFAEHELIGRIPWDLIIPEDVKQLVEEHQALWKAGHMDAHVTYDNLTKDGNRITCEWTNTPLFDANGEFDRAISMVQDVTERTVASDALRNSEMRYRMLFEHAGEGIFTMEGGILVSCNASAARILGRSVDQVAGVAPFEFSPPMQPSGKASDEKSRQLLGLAEKGVPVVFEWVFLRGGGDTVEAEVSLSKVDLPESKNFLLCFLRDISERKRALQQLKDSREQLRALAQRLDAVREDERRRLSRDLHDGLGQLITAIKIDLSLLRRHLSSQTRTETNETEHMLEGIDALLDSTLVQTRSLSRQLRDGLLDEEGVVAAMRLTVMEFVARTKIAYELKLPVDQLQMSPKIGLILLRVCQEALTNISRHAEASHFSVHLAANDGIVKLTIQDNGKSIAFDEIRNPHSLGILGMRERVASVGGIFNIQPGHGNGTQIHVEIPQHGVATVFGSRKQF